MKIAIALLFSSSVSVGCPQGYFEYKGDCQADIKPISAPAVRPSDEKPPSDKMPSYQREGVSIVDEKNMAYEDAKADEEKRDADAQGKKSAGIK